VFPKPTLALRAVKKVLLLSMPSFASNPLTEVSTPLKEVAVDRIESTSGRVPSWADSPEEYAMLRWRTATGTLSPTWSGCFGEDEQDRTFSVEINTQGTWVSTGYTVEKLPELCDDESDLAVFVTLNESSVLNMESNLTCNAIRVVALPIGRYSKYTDEFCFYIN
jgi:hypothetical protein